MLPWKRIRLEGYLPPALPGAMFRGRMTNGLFNWTATPSTGAEDGNAGQMLGNDAVSVDVTAGSEAQGVGIENRGLNDDEVPPGMQCDLKKVYAGEEDKQGRFVWETTIPQDLTSAVEDKATAKHAIIARYIKTYGDSRKTLELHSIIVQSPLLKKLLERVLRDYPGVTVGLARLKLPGNCMPLIHRWKELQDEIDAEQDAETKEHGLLLQKMLQSEFQDLIESTRDMIANRVITFEHIWTIFQPGMYIYSYRDSQDAVMKLKNSKYAKDEKDQVVFALTCEQVDWNGSVFGTTRLSLKIVSFDGTEEITSLSAYPFAYHDNQDEVRLRLIQRGGRVEESRGMHYKEYHGLAWRMNADPITFQVSLERFTIHDRIVIDTASWNRFCTSSAVSVIPFGQKDHVLGRDNVFNIDDPLPTLFPTNKVRGRYGLQVSAGGGIPMGSDEDSKRKHMPLTDEQKLICTPMVRGFALKTKMWLHFFVDNVCDITWSTGAFKSLVLPEDQKEMILGFTETQRLSESKAAFDDVIQGKGKGIIILLCGPPGVGKTLTAESVAEEMKVPLYSMSAGDLGNYQEKVESRLNNVLELCVRWNAVLLLDEADIFLEKRSMHDITRNQLVATFLRILEYYEGIMFLNTFPKYPITSLTVLDKLKATLNSLQTTNRVETFDPAFQSRIHISLEYPALSSGSRRTIWNNFLESNGQEHNITDADLKKLSQLDMNGRQIKNVLKTAQLLAFRKKEVLGYGHVKRVLDVTQHLHNATQATEQQRSSLFS